MEREVFENLSIASAMNRSFVNIKIDREEHPELDEIYMVARQIMTQEGGWPNHVFLTPELKPFHAGGTYGASDAYGKPAFPRLLEWLAHGWATKEEDIRKTADEISDIMQAFLIFKPGTDARSAQDTADTLFAELKGHHDSRSGGFFQAPKFPHEGYLSFLLAYHEATGSPQALEMVTLSLAKMAAGGIYDHVGGGFHRYAVDKEWYIPHFEKMLYTQAQLARVYTDAARLTGNPYLADVARSILDYTSSVMTSGNGAFYAAIDAETDQVEGAYYAWTAKEIESLLTPEETKFFTTFYALADIPQFPGHKHPEGQAIIARKPLDFAAAERGMPYVQLAAMGGQLLNKLLAVRNTRKMPHIDNKIIVGWNGLMIDAFAHAGRVLSEPTYIDRAQRAAEYLLDYAIDNEGRLHRIVPDGGRAYLDATLEDYAFLVKGLLSLWRARPRPELLDSAVSLMRSADDLLRDPHAEGYFTNNCGALMPMRIKGSDDSALPNANATMVHNLTELYAITQDIAYLDQARTLAEFFMKGSMRVLAEHASLVQYALALDLLQNGKQAATPVLFEEQSGGKPAPDDIVQVAAALFPLDAKPGERCEIIVTLDIREDWHINAHRGNPPFLIPLQVDVQGEGVEQGGVVFPEPLRRADGLNNAPYYIFEGRINVTLALRLGTKKQPLTVRLRYQPCTGTSCHKSVDRHISL